MRVFSSEGIDPVFPTGVGKGGGIPVRTMRSVICTATKIQDMKMKINPGDTMRLLFVKIHRIKRMRLCKLHGIKSAWLKRIAEEKRQ